jgi:hypothetical protein
MSINIGDAFKPFIPLLTFFSIMVIFLWIPHIYQFKESNINYLYTLKNNGLLNQIRFTFDKTLQLDIGSDDTQKQELYNILNSNKNARLLLYGGAFDKKQNFIKDLAISLNKNLVQFDSKLILDNSATKQLFYNNYLTHNEPIYYISNIDTILMDAFSKQNFNVCYFLESLNNNNGLILITANDDIRVKFFLKELCSFTIEDFNLQLVKFEYNFINKKIEPINITYDIIEESNNFISKESQITNYNETNMCYNDKYELVNYYCYI